MSEATSPTLDDFRKDLKFQLGFSEMDWDYFLETAKKAKAVADRVGDNFTEAFGSK